MTWGLNRRSHDSGRGHFVAFCCCHRPHSTSLPRSVARGGLRLSTAGASRRIFESAWSGCGDYGQVRQGNVTTAGHSTPHSTDHRLAMTCFGRDDRVGRSGLRTHAKGGPELANLPVESIPYTRTNCGSESKCVSRAHRTRECCRTRAAIHKSLVGMGVPCWRICR
jgi:hypothetical protein